MALRLHRCVPWAGSGHYRASKLKLALASRPCSAAGREAPANLDRQGQASRCADRGTRSLSCPSRALAGELERAMGIEPTAQAWEAWVLPLYDARLVSILLRFCRQGQPNPTGEPPRPPARRGFNLGTRRVPYPFGQKFSLDRIFRRGVRTRSIVLGGVATSPADV